LALFFFGNPTVHFLCCFFRYFVFNQEKQTKEEKKRRYTFIFFVLCERVEKQKLAVLINDVCSDCGNKKEVIIKKKISYCFWQGFFLFFFQQLTTKKKKKKVVKRCNPFKLLLYREKIKKEINKFLLQSSIKKQSTKKSSIQRLKKLLI
jgi:hypothetical protein